MRIKVQTSNLSHRCFEKYYALNNSYKRKLSHLKLRQYARYLKSRICILKKSNRKWNYNQNKCEKHRIFINRKGGVATETVSWRYTISIYHICSYSKENDIQSTSKLTTTSILQNHRDPHFASRIPQPFTKQQSSISSILKAGGFTYNYEAEHPIITWWSREKNSFKSSIYKGEHITYDRNNYTPFTYNEHWSHRIICPAVSESNQVSHQQFILYLIHN